MSDFFTRSGSSIYIIEYMMSIIIILLFILIYTYYTFNASQIGGSQDISHVKGVINPITIKVYPQYSTQHHIALVLQHYHPLFNVIITETPPEKDQLTIIMKPDAIAKGYETVVPLYNAELLLIGHNQSYVNSIEDLQGRKMTVNIGPKGSQLEKISMSLIEKAGLSVNDDVYVTNYSDDEVLSLFGYGIDFCFVLNANPNSFLTDLSHRISIKFLDLRLDYLADFNQIQIGIDEHRTYYPSINNFKFDHVWSYQTPFVLATPHTSDSTIINIAKESCEQFMKVFEKLPYWR